MNYFLFKENNGVMKIFNNYVVPIVRYRSHVSYRRVSIAGPLFGLKKVDWLDVSWPILN